ncbi:MAG: class D sortase [Actinomycetota bacterium]
MNRLRGTAAWLLVGAGIALVAFPALSYATGALEQRRLSAEVRTLIGTQPVGAEQHAASTARSTERRATPRPSEGEAIGLIRIPSIGLDVAFLEGVSDVVLRAGPGHLPWTALPGDAGPSVVAAHRDAHFRDLKDVSIGAEVRVLMPDRRISYRVIGRKVVDPDARWVTAPGGESVLRLVTCWPPNWIGPAPQRLVLTAVPRAPEVRDVRPAKDEMSAEATTTATERTRPATAVHDPVAAGPSGDDLPPLGAAGATVAGLSAFGAARHRRRLAWWFLPWMTGLGVTSMALLAAWAGPGLAARVA